MTTFTKDNVLKIITDDFESRSKIINHLFYKRYEHDAVPELAEKMWQIINITTGTVAYCLFRRMGCYRPTLESLENMSSFLGNLVDDSYFGIEYNPDKSIKSKYIHLSNFTMVWAHDDHPAIVGETEMSTFLDWYIHYAKNELIYTKLESGREQCDYGPLHHLSIIKNNWHEYPKQIKQAYDAYTKVNKNVRTA